jgi:hypothetical protein
MESRKKVDKDFNLAFHQGMQQVHGMCMTHFHSAEPDPQLVYGKSHPGLPERPSHKILQALCPHDSVLPSTSPAYQCLSTVRHSSKKGCMQFEHKP